MSKSSSIKQFLYTFDHFQSNNMVKRINCPNITFINGDDEDNEHMQFISIVFEKEEYCFSSFYEVSDNLLDIVLCTGYYHNKA